MNPQIQDYCRARAFSRNVVDGGLEYLVSRWRDTVTRLRKGYKKRGVFEYMDDLDGRSILEELLPLATEAERGAVLDAVSVLDAEFRDLTVASKERVSKSGNNREYWWLYRLPPNVELD